MAWQWFHRLGSPRWFYEKTSPWLPWLTVISIALIVTGAVWGLAFAPADYKQGNSYRIIYIHVPAAFLALAGYYIMAISGAVGLIWKMKLPFMVMKSAAPIGALLTFISLVTGSIWGKPTWGTWWEWDARITSML
ncbi:MAG TPA: cytochrome c biogenesis protein CcsA, partial [Cellvibrio sp.]